SKFSHIATSASDRRAAQRSSAGSLTPSSAASGTGFEPVIDCSAACTTAASSGVSLAFSSSMADAAVFHTRNYTKQTFAQDLNRRNSRSICEIISAANPRPPGPPKLLFPVNSRDTYCSEPTASQAPPKHPSPSPSLRANYCSDPTASDAHPNSPFQAWSQPNHRFVSRGTNNVVHGTMTAAN